VRLARITADAADLFDDLAIDPTVPLTVVPHGHLASVPWHSAVTTTGVLRACTPVTVLPSIGDLQRRPTRQGTATVLLATGPGVRGEEELDRIAGIAQEHYVVERDQGPGRTQLAGHEIVHLACHSTEHRRPIASELLLDHRNVSGVTIAAYGLGTRLTVLSACSTARAGLRTPDFATTMGALSYRAGSHWVLSTLWPLADHFAPYWFATFYRYLVDTQDIPASVHRTREALSQSTGDPFQWAAVTCIGLSR
jgi:CHAT domain-containing protein